MVEIDFLLGLHHWLDADSKHFVTLSGFPDFPDFSKGYPDFSRNNPNFHNFLGYRTTTSPRMLVALADKMITLYSTVMIRC